MVTQGVSRAKDLYFEEKGDYPQSNFHYGVDRRKVELLLLGLQFRKRESMILVDLSILDSHNNMPGRRGYQPPKEEIARAEGMMTGKQETMSRMREEDFRKLSDQMVCDLQAGQYDLQYSDSEAFFGGVETTRIRGKIGGTAIDIQRKRDEKGDRVQYTYTGNMDGKRIEDQQLLTSIFDKYLSVARLQDRDKPGFLGIGKHKSAYSRRADVEADIRNSGARARKERDLREAQLSEFKGKLKDKGIL